MCSITSSFSRSRTDAAHTDTHGIERLSQGIKEHVSVDEQQKEYFLKQQIKNIREELGEGNASPEKKEILEKAKLKNWSEETAKIFKKEIAKLDTLNPQSPDYSIQIGFLQTMVDLPSNTPLRNSTWSASFLAVVMWHVPSVLGDREHGRYKPDI